MLLYVEKPHPFELSFPLLKINAVQKSVIENRFIPLLKHLRWRTWRTAFLFNGGRIILTVGSLIVPALLSIQPSETAGTPRAAAIYWSTWVVSLFVTICNALLTLFKVDKRYYYLHTCMEQLVSDGWQYIELSGKYSGFNTPDVPPTHENQFIYFCHSVEKIRMRQVEEEYFKLIETPSAQPGAKINIDSLMPPTPLKEELKRLMQTIDSPIVNGSGTNITETPADSKNSEANKKEGTGYTSYGSSWSVPVPEVLPKSGPARGGFLQASPPPVSARIAPDTLGA